jgi:methyl-accepting chemotaxis protein
MQENSNLAEHLEIRNNDGKPFFVLLRRGEKMEEFCLRCHSSPQGAPSEMIRLYGANRSSYRNVGDVVSAVSIRVPLSDAFHKANRLIYYLSIVFFLLLLVVYAAYAWLCQILSFNPLDRLRQKALQISNDSHRLDEEIPISSTPELHDLTASFNQMSRNLRDSMDHLEERVQERTSALTNLNEQLQSEINERKKPSASGNS